MARAGNTVVREVSLEIPPGEVTALLGANGAGKSTLVLAIAGVIRPTAGKVILGEQDLTRLRPEQIRASGVAVVPEGRRMLHDLTVEDNLRVATYALSREDAEPGSHTRNVCFRDSRTARTLSGAPSRAASSRCSCSPRRLFSPKDPRRRRALTGSCTHRRQEPRAHPGGGCSRRCRRPPHRAVRARRARPRPQGVRPRGRPSPLRGHCRGPAAQPDILHSAYLTREARTAGSTADAVADG